MVPTAGVVGVFDEGAEEEKARWERDWRAGRGSGLAGLESVWRIAWRAVVVVRRRERESRERGARRADMVRICIVRAECTSIRCFKRALFAGPVGSEPLAGFDAMLPRRAV